MLAEVYEGDAGAAVLEGFVAEFFDFFDACQVFAGNLAEDAISFSMKDADFVDVEEDGIVDVVLEE